MARLDHGRNGQRDDGLPWGTCGDTRTRVDVSLRPALAFLLGLFLCAASLQDATAQSLDLRVNSPEGCPPESWFRAELLQNQLRGALRVDLSRRETGEFVGEISFPGSPSVSTRRLSGPLCQTVAEGLVLVASVHLASDPPPEVLPAPSPPSALRTPLVALGLSFVGDSSLPRTLSFGAGGGLWLSRSPHRLRGLMLQGLYSRASAEALVPVRFDHLRARLDLIPWDVPIGAATRLGAGSFLSGGALRADAALASRNTETRALWATGLSSRLRADTGPLWIDLELAASLALTRRRFEITGLEGPLLSLPPWALSASLSVWVPLEKGSK